MNERVWFFFLNEGPMK